MNAPIKTFCPSVVDQLSFPSFVQVKRNLRAAKFDLMKFTPAKAILDDAISSGRLQPGGHVIESSSGTFALALAILCSLYELRLTLVTGPVSPIVRWRLENLGARLHIVEASKNCEGGIQLARLNVLAKILADHPGSFWPQQYTNPLNAVSYKAVAQLALSTGPRIDIIVGSVGSGGSLFGMAKVLQEANPALRVIAVDHTRSVIFGAEAKKITRMCRETFEQLLAMGAGIPMGNVNFQACDEVHWVSVPRMVRKVHQLHEETGCLVGPSSGAALLVAEREANLHPDANVLTILPDHGVRYVESMFNPNWLNNWKADFQCEGGDPVLVSSLEDVTEDWCRFHWNRRTFREIKGHDPVPRPAGYNP